MIETLLKFIEDAKKGKGSGVSKEQRKSEVIINKAIDKLKQLQGGILTARQKKDPSE
ncbi:hypothetical protein Dimus_032312, partial [Dionaea muscipula]